MLMTDDKVPGLGAEKGTLACNDRPEQLMRAWPLVSSWIFKNFEAAILKRRMRGLLMKSWSIWVDEADIIPPALHTPSDSNKMSTERFSFN